MADEEPVAQHFQAHRLAPADASAVSIRLGAGAKVLPDAGADGSLVAPHDHGVQATGIAAVLEVSNFRCKRRIEEWTRP